MDKANNTAQCFFIFIFIFHFDFFSLVNKIGEFYTEIYTIQFGHTLRGHKLWIIVFNFFLIKHKYKLLKPKT